MSQQDQVKALYGIYEVRVLSGRLAATPTMNEEVPRDLIATGNTYSKLDVVVRMLSIYDGCHGICRDLSMFEATVNQLLLASLKE